MNERRFGSAFAQDGQDLLAVGLELPRADAADAGERVERIGAQVGHLRKRRVVEDDVGGQVVRAGDFAALKAWRAGVAKAHNLPAYVVFHDATLAEMAEARPGSLDELAAIGGVGAKKLDAYGEDILRVLAET